MACTECQRLAAERDAAWETVEACDAVAGEFRAVAADALRYGLESSEALQARLDDTADHLRAAEAAWRALRAERDALAAGLRELVPRCAYAACDAPATLRRTVAWAGVVQHLCDAHAPDDGVAQPLPWADAARALGGAAEPAVVWEQDAYGDDCYHAALPDGRRLEVSRTQRESRHGSWVWEVRSGVRGHGRTALAEGTAPTLAAAQAAAVAAAAPDGPEDVRCRACGRRWRPVLYERAAGLVLGCPACGATGGGR